MTMSVNVLNSQLILKRTDLVLWRKGLPLIDGYLPSQEKQQQN